MEEQMTLQPEYKEEPLPPTTEAASTPEPETEIQPEEVRVSDGELSFGDKFFGDMAEAPKEDTPKEEAPKWYTDEELKNTPFEEWDISRLNGDVVKYAREVQDQLHRRNAQRNAAAMQEIPLPSDIQEVKPYTVNELSDASRKLACEKLGLEDPEDFDDYEPEHRAAMQLAMYELMTKRNAEVSVYQRGVTEWKQLQKFNAELSSQRDFREFNEWCMNEFRKFNVTPEQVSTKLYKSALSNGNNFMGIAQTIAGWYQEFQKSKQARTVATTSTRGIRRSGSNPAVLESSQGNNNVGTRHIDYRDFGNMTPDEQAEALIKLGYV